jgi:GTP pyrophosphokinase
LETKYTDFLSKLDDGHKHQDIIIAVSKIWQDTKPVQSPIELMNSHQYTLRILSILKNEFNTHSTTLLSAAMGMHNRFFDQKMPIEANEMTAIADSFLRISQLPTHTIKKQADNYRSMLLNVAGDLRAVLISMAECILALRYYPQLSNKAQQQSTLDLAQHVYIPVAHRLGFYKIKSNMEDLALRFEQPASYADIHHKLKKSEGRRQEIIANFIAPIQQELLDHGLEFVIKGRTKSIHSIYTKMQKQGLPFEKVFDLWAVRIILQSEPKEEKSLCWHAYSVVTNLYTPSLTRLRDWISVPRENGYESLHATVQTPEKRWVEVQIRTQRMDDEAENGMAAHWRYKGGKSQFGIDFWLENIRKALEKEDQLMGNEEFRNSKFSTELFAFTPQGDLKKLKIGATVLDFAFAIHSEVGVKCTGGIVNGKNASMKQLLRNGDQVHILTSKNQKPSLDWLNMVSSNRAKLRIKKAFDELGQREAEQGKEILLRRLKNWKINYHQDVLEKLLSHYEYKTISDLYRGIYHEKIDLPAAKKFLLEVDTSKTSILSIVSEIAEPLPFEEKDDENDDTLIIDHLNNVNYNLARCCMPKHGDRIFGFVTVSKGISIHRHDCTNAPGMKERYPYRIITAIWNKKDK